MGLLDLFSSSPGQTAAASAAQAKNKKAKQALKAAKQGAQAGTQALTKYTGQAVSTAGKGLPAWQQIFGQGAAMSPYYMGALGVGTPEQIAGAGQAFGSSIPGQEFAALLPDIYETSLRRGGVTGQTGNIPIDLTNRSMQALNQFYPGWQASLNPLSYETAGAGGAQGAYNTQSGLQAGLGSGIAGLNQWLANAKIGQYGTMGQTNADRIAQAYGAGQGANQNTLSALFGLGQLAMAPFTGGATLPGAMGSFSKMFGGSSGTGTGSGFDPIQGGYDPNWTAMTSVG